MLQNKKVIIYLQVFNGEKYLKECIESVLNQTYLNFEFYIIDNASKDSSPQIIKHYSVLDSRIKPMLYSDNILGRWIDMIDDFDDQSYFTIIDHDDYWNINYLELLIEFMNLADLDMSICSSNCFSEEKGEHFSRHVNLEKSIVIDKKNFPQAYKKFRIILSTLWGYISKISILKEIKEKAYEVRNSKINMGGDSIITLEYIKHCGKIGVLKDELYFYRMHDNNSISYHKYDPLLFKSVVMYISEYEKFIKEYNCFSGEIKSSIYNLYFNHILDIFNRIDFCDISIEERLIVYNEIFNSDMNLRYLKDCNFNLTPINYRNKLLEVINFILEIGNENEKRLLKKTLKYLPIELKE